MLSSLLLAVTIVAHDPGYSTSLANHLARWMSGESIAARVCTAKDMAPSLKGEKLAFLVGFNEPTSAEFATLRNFRSRGGKLVVFHSASPQLAALMGVKPLGYATAPYPGAWSRMDFLPAAPAAFPRSILQTSGVLQRAAPLPGRGRVLAVWKDRKGRATGDAAWISTDAGYWMTHVLLADGDEHLKVRLLGAICSSVDPKSWSLAVHQARERRKMIETRDYAKAQVKRPGEIHAIWDHSGCGLYPGDWPRTMRMLANSHVTDVFVNVAGAGFAHYPSKVLPRSKTFEQEGDQLAAALQAAKGTGIRVHAWILCFTATRGTPDRLETFRRRGWRLKTREGTLSEYLDPSNADVRNYLLNAISEIRTNYRVDGIHLDFVRWYERSVKPANAAQHISNFVSEARRRVKRPCWLTTAVLGKYPSCVDSVGQDWCGWIDANTVDFVVPMDYTEDNLKFASYIAQHAARRSRARRIIAGIGVTANESRLDARKVIDQIRIARGGNLAGEAIFDLDVFFEKRIAPYLTAGIW